MKIAIIGTRGIPNYHGGFEQFAEYFSQYLVEKGHDVYVYNSHNHPFQERIWKGVHIIHKKDPENKLGTAGQFFYDLNCIRDSRKRNYDIILQCGYTSSSIWGKLLPKKTVIVTNMDGLEWKRSKYSKPVRRFLKYAEKLAIHTSDYLISDSLGIQSYIEKTYKEQSEYIAYGAESFLKPVEDVILEYDVKKFEYNLLIARLEPENNIETILDGVLKSNSIKPFLVIGKYETKFGSYLKEKFRETTNIRFLGGVYNINHLNNLRYWSNLYFHGHSVGGTNPSLLEAMASDSFIIANDNLFNKSILQDNALYFTTANDVAGVMKLNKSDYLNYVKQNKIKIESEFNWNLINSKYEKFLLKCLS